jgi:hypothetical protein
VFEKQQYSEGGTAIKILVLGTGCYNCLNLEMRVARLLGELGLSQVQLIWTDDPHQIRKFLPEDALPGLVINGHLISSGRLPDEAEIRQWLNQAAQLEQAV